MVDLVQTRRLMGLNQQEMADKADVSKNIIVDLEMGKLKATAYPSTLRKLASAYGVTIDQISQMCAEPSVASSP